MQSEEFIASDKLRPYELDPSRGLAIRPRKKIFVKNDEAIKLLVQEFDRLRKQDEIHIFEFLRAIQYRLLSSGFDTADDGPIETQNMEGELNV